MSYDLRDYYDDLEQMGGLHSALVAEFRTIGSELKSYPPTHMLNSRTWTVYRDGNRSANVSIATNERLFMFGAWMDGLHVAEGSTPHLYDVAVSIDAWIERKVRIQDLPMLAPSLIALDSGIAYAAGTYLDYVWKQWLEIGEDDDRLDPAYLFLLAASEMSELRQLLPWTSVGVICFSRCLGHPHTKDTPYVIPQGDGIYEVRLPDDSIVMRGEIEEALVAVVDNLPPGTGLARPGTADD